MRLHVIGNSHVWTIVGWESFAGTHESVRMESTSDGLTLIGIAVTGATAHNMVEDASSTGSRTKVLAFLDSEPDRRKRVLAVLGDVDLRSHVHGAVMLRETLARYLSFLRSISDRPDVECLMVSSITGHHAVIADRMEDVGLWNLLLEQACLSNGWTYVDLFTPGEGMGQLNGLPHENHLEPKARTPILRSIIRAVDRSGEAGC